MGCLNQCRGFECPLPDYVKEESNHEVDLPKSTVFTTGTVRSLYYSIFNHSSTFSFKHIVQLYSVAKETKEKIKNESRKIYMLSSQRSYGEKQDTRIFIAQHGQQKRLHWPQKEHKHKLNSFCLIKHS